MPSCAQGILVMPALPTTLHTEVSATSTFLSAGCKGSEPMLLTTIKKLV